MSKVWAMVLSEAKKKEGRFCCAYGCSNNPAPKKGGLCHKHYKRKRRASDPIGVRYNDLVQSTKRRGKRVYFSLGEFRVWCQRNRYLSKGRRGQAATLDRRCNAHDYYLWNLRIISNRANASKGNRFSGDHFTREHHFGIIPKEFQAEGAESLPF